MKVFTAAQMREFDRAATEEYSIPSIVLMENAALRVVEFLEMKFSPLRGKGITVVCGKGNNGGDGFAIARHSASNGAFVSVLSIGSSENLSGDARVNYEAYKNSLVPIEGIDLLDLFFTEVNEQNIAGISYELAGHDLIIDALLGTGFHGSLSSEPL